MSKGAAAIIVLGLGGGLLLLSRLTTGKTPLKALPKAPPRVPPTAPPKKGRGKVYYPPMKITENFNLGEFLESKAKKAHGVSEPELSNILKLATNVLQPGRKLFGAIRITEGVWPGGYTEGGLGRYEALEARGYKPAKASDHGDKDKPYASAVDVKPVDISQAMPLFNFWSTLRGVRQVILYLKTNPKTKVIHVSHLHVSGPFPGHPVIKGPLHAFVFLDGKRITAEDIPQEGPPASKNIV